MALNKVMLIGNVGADPEIRYLDQAKEAKVANIRLATSERYKDRNGEQRENTEWHTLVAFRKTADVVEKYIHKGDKIFIEGKIRTRSWEDKDGNNRYSTEIVVDSLQILGGKKDSAATEDDMPE